MAKLKMLKYPKKPKASASITTKENYLRKVKEIDKINSERKRQNQRSDQLTKQISGIRQK